MPAIDAAAEECELGWLDQDGDGLGDPQIGRMCQRPGVPTVDNDDDPAPNCMTNDIDACGVCAGKGPRTWYRDRNADGVGDAADDTTLSCAKPAGYVLAQPAPPSAPCDLPMGTYVPAFDSYEHPSAGIACVVIRPPDRYEWGDKQLVSYSPGYPSCYVKSRSFGDSGCAVHTEFLCGGTATAIEDCRLTSPTAGQLVCTTKFESILECTLKSTHSRVACPAGAAADGGRCIPDCSSGSSADGGLLPDAGGAKDAGTDAGTAAGNPSDAALATDAAPRVWNGRECVTP